MVIERRFFCNGCMKYSPILPDDEIEERLIYQKHMCECLLSGNMLLCYFLRIDIMISWLVS